MLLAAAGCNYFMGVPMGDDPMLSYQSNSFHDASSLRQILKLAKTACETRRQSCVLLETAERSHFDRFLLHEDKGRLSHGGPFLERTLTDSLRPLAERRRSAWSSWCHGFFSSVMEK